VFTLYTCRSWLTSTTKQNIYKLLIPDIHHPSSFTWKFVVFLDSSKVTWPASSSSVIVNFIQARDLQSFEIRFESAVPIQFDWKMMGRFKNFRIGRACPLLVIVKRLKPLTALSGPVYRLSSFTSDHMPVLFNMFKEWNEKSVVCIYLFCFICN